MPYEYCPKQLHIRAEAWKRTISVIKDKDKLERDYTAAKDERHINELERKLSALYSVQENTSQEVRELIFLRYNKGISYRDIPLPMSISTMKRYVRAYVINLGKALGEIE